MYWRKNILGNNTEFANSQKLIGRFFWFQKPYNGKVYFQPCFYLLKKKESGQIEKTQQVYLGEKEGEKISAIRNTVIRDAENLGLVPVLEPYSDKDSTMGRNLRIIMQCMTWRHTRRKGCVSQSRITEWTNHPSFRFDSSLQRITKSWSKLPTSTILWTNSRNFHKSWENLCLLGTLMFNNFVEWLYYYHVIQLIIFLNQFLNFFWAEQYEVEHWFFQKSYFEASK